MGCRLVGNVLRLPQRPFDNGRCRQFIDLAAREGILASHEKYERTLRYGEVHPALVEAIRGSEHTADMFDEVPGEGSSVPREIVDAEEWRVLGEKLRALSPELYREVLTALAAVSLGSDDDAEKIT